METILPSFFFFTLETQSHGISGEHCDRARVRPYDFRLCTIKSYEIPSSNRSDLCLGTWSAHHLRLMH